MKFEIENIDRESQNKIIEFVNYFSKEIFKHTENPIETFFIGDLENKLMSYLTDDEKILRENLNKEKSVLTAGKIMPYIRNDKYTVDILLNSITLKDIELFLFAVPHEMTHVCDYKNYFDLVDKKPFHPNYKPNNDDYYVEYVYWSEYNANRIGQIALNNCNIETRLHVHNMHDNIEILLEKLKKAKYHTYESKEKNYIVYVALKDFISSFLIFIGKCAELNDGKKKLEKFLSYNLTRRIFNDSLNQITEIMGGIFAFQDFQAVIDAMPKIRKAMDEIIQRLNSFSLSNDY